MVQAPLQGRFETGVSAFGLRLAPPLQRSRGMDALIWIAGALVSSYTLFEIAGLLLHAEPPRRRTRSYHAANFQPPHRASFTVDLEPIPGRRANYYG